MLITIPVLSAEPILIPLMILITSYHQGVKQTPTQPAPAASDEIRAHSRSRFTNTTSYERFRAVVSPHYHKKRQTVWSVNTLLLAPPHCLMYTLKHCIPSVSCSKEKAESAYSLGASIVASCAINLGRDIQILSMDRTERRRESSVQTTN